VRIETIDGEVSSVTMPTHEFLNRFKKDGILPCNGDDEERVCRELRKLLAVQRAIDGLSV
jgi:hypothetical protein